MTKNIGGEISSIENISFLKIVIVFLDDELGYFKDDIMGNVVPFVILEIELSRRWEYLNDREEIKIDKIYLEVA